METFNYQEPIAVGEGIYWVGFYDEERNLHCNPYLIVDGEEAVLIDSGSRTDFSSVMTKILQTGVEPAQIKHLIYHHYDPDLCSSIPHFEQLLDRENIKLISHKENNVFIRYYAGTVKMFCIESLGQEITFGSGRRLQFRRTPYAHSAGSFVTFDEKTGTLFSSDLFGSYDKKWDLFIELSPECRRCTLPEECPAEKSYCPLQGIFTFHRRIMTSRRALKYAMETLQEFQIQQVAPQHGSIVWKKEDITCIIERLAELDGVGIDAFI